MTHNLQNSRPSPTRNPEYGAIVISLDLEQYWGVRDTTRIDGHYRPNLLGERQAVPLILELFREFEIGATWATVGFLFARDSTDLQRFNPQRKPSYTDARLSPYDDRTGNDESDDPLHFGSSVVTLVRSYPHQEIGTHTYSHYYCRANGQTLEEFDADMKSAVSIAERDGVSLSAIVFPRNQHNRDYDEVLRKYGIRCFRGNQSSWMYDFDAGSTQTHPLYRTARLIDAYVNLSGLNLISWDEVWSDGLANIPASAFLRPVTPGSRLEPLRLERIRKALRAAADQRKIFHLWWHPHNFGVNCEENLAFLRLVFETVAELRSTHDFRSMNMTEAAEAALALRHVAP